MCVFGLTLDSCESKYHMSEGSSLQGTFTSQSLQLLFLHANFLFLSDFRLTERL